ncbi:hypothetical protein [Fibrobacter sp.]|uniref:hypothetical protein n=1 Tax=Fibrobacter sp. TaxID=35828 RepID=UPI003865C9C7
MRKLYCARILFAALVWALVWSTVAASQSLDEAKVFEWWDSGVIDGDEAREILDLIEEGNLQEACMLAEVYALESCAADNPLEKQHRKASAPKKLRKESTRTEDTHTSKEKATRTQKQEARPSVIPHGYIEWRGRTDSLGHLESERTELRLDFYRYSLRLGTQSLLTYKNAGSEAHLGQISTKELHSNIPLDTLWGTAAFYPIWKFRLGALLDTAKTTRASLGFVYDKGTELELAYWRHQHTGTGDSSETLHTERHSVSAMAKGNWGSFATWWIPGRDIPLFKIQLHYREKTDLATVAWKADAYLHGDSLPREAHLSSTIASSRFWGSQTLAVTAVDSWRSKFGVNARTIIPLEGDSSRTRLKASAETGPDALRGTASATCLSAEERCRQNDFDLRIKSSWNVDREQLAFSGKIRTRHTRDEGFGTPLYEAGATYALDSFNSAGVAVAIPKGSPARELQVRSSAEVGTDFLQLSLAVTFRRTAETPLHPLHAALKARIMF